MGLFFRSNIFRRVFLVAAPLAICLLLFFPAVSEAHAILLRSIPAKDAILSIAPSRVQMWFSEDLNPSFSTAAVINASSQRVDNGDAHVSPNDSTEMDLTLKPNLPPAVYIVLWRSDSNADGHVLRGSFIFSVARPDGTVPKLSGGTIPGQDILGGGNSTGLYTGQFDGPTFFNFIAITLVELGAVFWVGAQLWHILVLQLVTGEDEEQSSLHKGVHRRFEQRFSLPVLLVLFVANIGVLLGQAINLTGGQWASAFSLSLLGGLITSGRFGTYWLMREIVIAVAILLALYILLLSDRLSRRSPIYRGTTQFVGGLNISSLFKQRPQNANKLLPWANLILGLALFIAITMSGHAAAVSKGIVVYAIIIDWLHLLSSALWVGGMMYVATTYLPAIRRRSIAERAQSLITVLPYYSPWALIGVLIMAITGPFSATFHLSSWDQFLATAYGRALIVKILLVGALLITSAIHVLLLRPRVAKEYKKYAHAVERLEHRSMNWPSTRGKQEPDRTVKQLSQQVKLREERLSKRTQRLTDVMRWEPLLGVAVLVCVGLMNVFAGTLSPTAVAPQQQQSTTAPKPFHKIVETSDGKFTVALTVDPNRFGPNLFTVNVVDNATHKPTTDVGVSLYTTMLDMDMGTDTVNLKPDGQGNFKATADLSMGGNWEIRVQIRTPDNQLHEAKVKLFTPF